MELWNTRYLEPPPSTTCKGSIKQQGILSCLSVPQSSILSISDLLSLRNVLKEALNMLGNKYLNAEAALLSRIIYRMKSKFHTDKGFRNLEKLNRALRIHLQTDLTKPLKLVLGLLPLKHKPKLYLPTRNLLYFLLVRIQGVSALLKRVLETCRTSAYFMESRIAIGHFWKLGLICFGAVSRISKIVLGLITNLCDVYSKLLRFEQILHNKGVEWLPEGYVFPVDLNSFLCINFSENNIDSLSNSKNINEEVNQRVLDLELSNTQNGVDDIGELVPLNILPGKTIEMKSLGVKKRSIIKLAKRLSIPEHTIDILEGINDVASLQRFAKREHKLRKTGVHGNAVLVSLNNVKFKKLTTIIHETVEKCSDASGDQEIGSLLYRIKIRICKFVSKAQQKAAENDVEKYATVKAENVLKRIHTPEDLRTFLRRENKLRKTGSQDGFLKNVDASQYGLLQKSILRCIKECEKFGIDSKKCAMYLDQAKQAIGENINSQI